jgi:hypothetical protein
MSMTRRAFIAAVATAAVATVTVWTVGPRRLLRDARRRYLEHFGPSEAEVAAEIKRHYSHLQLQEGVAERFVQDYRSLGRGLYPLTVPLRQEAGARFLLSTDFIQQGADPARPVNYVVFWEPYSTVCYNPFMMVARDEQGVVI